MHAIKQCASICAVKKTHWINPRYLRLVNMFYGWDLCWKRGSFLLSSPTIWRHLEMKYSATEFIAVLKSSQMMSSRLFLSIHPSHWQGEKPGLLHTLKSGLKYCLLQRTGGFWKSSALNSFTSPPVAAAGSDHTAGLCGNMTFARVYGPVQALHSKPSFSSAFVQKEVRDMAGKNNIPF